MTLTACATTVASSGIADEQPAPDPTEESSTVPAGTTPPSSSIDSTTSSSTAASTSTTAETTSTTTPTTTPTTTSTTTTSTPTTTELAPIPEVADPDCVRAIGGERTFETVAADAGVSVTELWVENELPGDIAALRLVDICVDNGIDDIFGVPRAGIDDDTLSRALAANVELQQERLNELFGPYGTGPLAADGISGPLTGRQLCAARVALGFEPTVDDMFPGSDEQAALFAATTLPAPASTVTGSERWAIIDRTCQMMFVGAGDELVFVFPTSTGSQGFETREQDRSRVFRYNPAVDNGGWHDSTEFPVGVDNPLNGNLYKPLYFDLGQAIHGANNVPPSPASKGCARLSVGDQESLLEWLGLLDATEETWLKDEINLTVNVQGEFVGR